MDLFNLVNQGVSILPAVNLVKNIGFDGQATHTGNMGEIFAMIEAYELKSVVFNKEIKIDNVADRFTFDHYYSPKNIESLWSKMKRKLRLK